MNEFHRDDHWQREIRDRVLVPEFYQKRTDGRFVLMDKGRLAGFMQKRMAVDTIAQRRSGEAVSVEEKIVRWKGRVYTAFCLETHSCTVKGRESPGWMVYGDADYLLYCFQQDDGSLLCYLMDFQRLKEWFWPLEDRWPTTETTQINRTRCRKVPIAEVQAAVPCWRFRLGHRVPA